MSLYPPPINIDAKVWTSLPDEYRVKDTSPVWLLSDKL